MTIINNSNGYTASGIQKMLNTFNNAAEKLFPACEIEHFYYGDKLSMTTLRLRPGRYAHFNISENRVSLTGYECSREELTTFQSMTYKDELYKGNLLQLARA
jgi:hypothetical protein